MSAARRLLIVEDSPDDIELILGVLKDHVRAEVDVVRDGAAALDYLRREGPFAGRADEHPVAVILDLKLPKIGGLEVLRVIRSTEDLANLPVVVLSSSRQERDVDASYEFGANAYVVKPLKYAEFAEAVRKLGRFWGDVNELPARRR